MCFNEIKKVKFILLSQYNFCFITILTYKYN